MDAKITLFTPTYNRAYIIEKLYRSLQRQSIKLFEWLVIDDGSTDDTAQLFDKWLREDNGFQIRYYKTSNGGKHRAVNCGLDLAKCEYFMVVDSDDYLTDDAVEKLCQWLKAIEDDNSLMGVIANKGYSTLETPNEYFKDSFLDKSFLDMNLYEEDGRKVLSGERAICFKTEFHRQYKYPEFDGEKFVTEAVVYNRMANDGFNMRFFNDIIWIYEYQADGLSQSGGELYLKNPKGYGLWVREKADFERLNVMERLKVYYAFFCDMNKYYDAEEIAKCIGTGRITIYLLLCVHRFLLFIKRKG